MTRRRSLLLVLLALPLVIVLHRDASAQVTYTVYGFDQSVPAATAPEAGVIKGSDGAFYGTTNGNFCGAVYRLDPATGVRTVLHVFKGHFAVPPEGPDGCQPRGELVEGPDGLLYGMTLSGGASANAVFPAGTGTIYRLSKSGDAVVYEVLYSFFAPSTGGIFPDGALPAGGLTLGPDGVTFYGTTNYGGTGGPAGDGGGCISNAGVAGTFFRFDPPFGPSNFHVLHSFDPATDGCGPMGNLTLAADGSFVGATTAGGYTQTQAFAGTVFKVTTSGVITPLFMFPVNPTNGYPYGGNPTNSPIEGPGGDLYGTTSYGGPPNGGNEVGTIYKLTFQGGTWQPTRLHAFTGGSAGAYPLAGLTVGFGDQLYGVTLDTIFRIARLAPADSPVETLHTFGSIPNDGFSAKGRLLETAPGVFVGTTPGGNGTAIGGSVFSIDVSLAGTTSTILNASPSAPVFGQTVTLTVTVSSGSGTPTGQVEFLDGATSLGAALLSGGQAAIATSILAVGAHVVTATYSGDSVYTGSTSASVTVTVSPAPTATSVAASTTAAVVGENVTFTATVSSATGTPTGQVDFYDGATLLGTASLSGGQAIFVTSAAGIGTHSVSATYIGDGNFAGSISGIVVVTVGQAATTTILSATPNPAARKETIVVTAMVGTVAPGGGTPGGQVQLMEGKKRLGTSVLANGVATFQIAFPNIGDHVLTAIYSGDPDYAGGTSAPFTQKVTK